MERQGSPIEQCALLVYLLRQAGVPAVYEFPAENGLKMLDTQLSKILRMQIHGAINNGVGANDQAYTTNSLIAVNYPWVAAYIGTNWVHLFPWLKDTEVVEGLNLYDYMPSNYKTAYQWLRAYLFANTNITSLSADDDTPQTLFPLFIKQSLLENAPGISMDDIGVQFRNRRHLYTRWTDFPRPPVVTNVSVAIESLGSTAITNVNPRLTNIFDTVSVTVSSVTNPATKLATGNLRLLDLHNRKFLIRHEKISSTSHRIILSLEPYRPDATGVGNFANDATLLKQQSLTNTLGSSDDALNVQFVFSRHRSLPVGFQRPDYDLTYLGLLETTSLTNSRPLRKGDLGAICLNVGRVTPQMLEVHAQELWNMENTLQLDPSATNTLSPDVYQGTVAYLMGMAYFETVGRFDAVNQRLHKIHTASQLAFGLASIRAARTNNALPSGNINLVQPSLDLFYQESAIAGNTTIHPDSGDDGLVPDDDYFHMYIGNGSAQEHSLINHFFHQNDAVSTVKLLQLAQLRSATNGQPGILTLDFTNYVAEGNKNYPIGGTTKLKDQSPTLWATITNAFLSDSELTANYVQALITPGPVTNQTKTFKGMAALLISPSGATAAIAEKNGGYGENLADGSLNLANTPNMSLSVDSDNNYSINLAPPGAGNITLAPDSYAGYDAGSVADYASQNYYDYSDYQSLWTDSSMDLLGLGSQGGFNADFSQSVQAATGDEGFLGWLSDALGQAASHVSDPVHAVTGEFYVKAADLTLPGPMPLTVSRNYSSLNLADNQFGYGWKLNYMPYLSLNTNASVIYAAEPDGAVLAYEQTGTNANIYLPTPAKNPQLNNNATAGIGSTANRLRNYIEKGVNGTDVFYYLYPPTGGKRTFLVMSFTGTVDRTRPYLTRWEDSRGNAFTFEYGTDSTQSDYAEVRRIQSSNGSYLGFHYNAYRHVTDAYTGDGRRLEYQYDQFGDLVAVTLPDQSVVQYEYQHKTQNVTNGTVVTVSAYSTHLILKEDKPDGRTLKNEYDQNRRVTNQWATVGPDLNLVRNASFSYVNNFNLTNSFTNTITGYTIIKDVNNNTSRYDYTNGLITKITDALNQAIVQDWYETTETNKPGYYPRSLESRLDKRGLLTQFQYDANGNVTNTITTGDLAGDGTTQSATNTVAYDANNLPTLVTDPVGNQIQSIYDPQYAFLPKYIVQIAGGIPVSSNLMVYGNVTNAFVAGGINYTNLAQGLLERKIRAAGSPDAATNDWIYDGRGFLTQNIGYTGTEDPAITNKLVYDDRGELVEQTDGDGRIVKQDYDPMGRPSYREVFESGQTVPLGWNYTYYNENGEVVWNDGPRYNPEDYVWHDYDGAGRQIAEVRWRSQAKADGTGVEAPPEAELYAQTFQEYDSFGNLIRVVSPLGVITTNTWDAIGQLISRKVIDSNAAVLTSEEFAYEPGGLVTRHTNALNGVEQTLYTASGKPEFQLAADGSTNGWRYYLDGRVRRKIQRNGAYWETTYDDANRTTTRIFYSATGTPLATNSTILDRRGNAFVRTDEGGNSFTNIYDGLDRIKRTAGPFVLTVSVTGLDPDNPVYVTNYSQQLTAYLYDGSGRVATVTNALGEKTITTRDALGRTVNSEIYAAGAGTPLRVTTTSYRADHQGFTVTNGTGTDSIVNTTYTDNDGHNLLSIGHPSNNAQEFIRNVYDLAGNLAYQERDSATNGAVTTWSTVTYAYDGLNRQTYKQDRDNAETFYSHDALGDLTNRTMPGGLQWNATYNTAGQMTKEWNLGTGGNGTRTNNYTYYGTGNSFAGLLQTQNDGIGLTSTYSYDAWLRPATNIHSSTGWQNKNTSWSYDARGLLTSMAQWNDGNGAITLTRTYDAYGQISSESVNVPGLLSSGAGQNWDAAGRRTTLSFGSFTYNFGWRADGLLAAAMGTSYAYDGAGVLTNRMSGSRDTTVSSRDGVGRPLAITTKVNSSTKLTETLGYTGDGLLNTHTLAREDFTDYRSYAYADLSRRLTEERLNLDGSTRWTNNFTYDSGTAAGPGMLTRVGTNSGSAIWSGTADTFSRLGTATNAVVHRAAYGRVNGDSTINVSLDGTPSPVTLVSTNDSNWPWQWRTTMELAAGAHQLTVTAKHPSGLFTTNTTVIFTNNAANEVVTEAYDGRGKLTQRIWHAPGGTTNRTQTLTWDALGRLEGLTDLDASQNGHNLQITYDPLNRRVFEYDVDVTGGVYDEIHYHGHYFDPLVEFLELGQSEDFEPATWKIYGPDLNGRYGGLNGTGGFEATVSPVGQITPTVSDARGNVLGAVTNTAVAWTAARPTGYGAVPGYRPLPLWHGANVIHASAWRGRWADASGYVWLGARYYDPEAGRFLDSDPAWNERDPNYHTFAGGDPINGFDADGRQGYMSANPTQADYMEAAQEQYWLHTTGQPFPPPPMSAEDQQLNNSIVVLTFGAVLAPVTVSALGAAGGAVTTRSLLAAAGIGGVVNGTASGIVAGVRDQPVLPAVFGGGVEGIITGPFAVIAPEVSLPVKLMVGTELGFTGGTGGDVTSQLWQNNGFGGFNMNNTLIAGGVGVGATVGGQQLGNWWGSWGAATTAATAQENTALTQMLIQSAGPTKFALGTIGLDTGAAAESVFFQTGQMGIEYGLPLLESDINASFQQAQQSAITLSKH